MSSVSSLIFYGKYFLYYRCAIVNIMIIYFIVVFQKNYTTTVDYMVHVFGTR